MGDEEKFKHSVYFLSKNTDFVWKMKISNKLTFALVAKFAFKTHFSISHKKLFLIIPVFCF